MKPTLREAVEFYAIVVGIILFSGICWTALILFLVWVT